MGAPSYPVAVEAFFKDLGAKKGLEALTGATMSLTDATAALRDKTWAATGSVRGFADAGKEGFLDMSANLSRTAVLQGKVYSQTGDILSAQLKASVEAAESVGMVQELQKEFEAVGKATVQNIGEFAKLQKVLQVSPNALASWDKTLEAQGFSEKQVVSLTKELGGLSKQLGVEPGPLLAQMPDLARLVLERAATLGKEGVPFIKKYMKENIGLSAALTSQGLQADEAASAAVSMSKLTFDSAKQMNKALAGVSQGSMPEFLRMANISLGDFKTAFDLAAQGGPVALVQAFKQKTDEIRKNTGNDKRAMQNWRQFMDETIGDPALVALIVDGQKDIGKAFAAVNRSAEENLKDYNMLSDATLKNAKALRDRRDAAWEALKVDSAEKLILPTMTTLWEAQSKALIWGRGKLDEWVQSGNTAQATVASLAGATVLYSGDVLDWTVKAGGAIKNLKELGTGFSDMAKVLPGIGGAFGKVGGAIKTVGGGMSAFAKFDVMQTGTQLKALSLFVRGTVVPTMGIHFVTAMAAGKTAVISMGTTMMTAATTYFPTFAAALTGTVIPAIGAFLVAAAPFLIFFAAAAAAVAAALFLFDKWADSQEKAGQAATKFADRQRKVIDVLVETDKVRAKAVAQELHAAKSPEERERIIAREETELRGRGKLSMADATPATGPTPALPISALPGGGPQVRLAIQVLEESRAQTGILEQIAAALGAMSSMGGGAPRAVPSGVRIDMRPGSGGLRLDRLLEVRARNVLGRAGYPFGGTAFTH